VQLISTEREIKSINATYAYVFLMCVVYTQEFEIFEMKMYTVYRIKLGPAGGLEDRIN
jgi:hypothetical protein